MCSRAVARSCLQADVNTGRNLHQPLGRRAHITQLNAGGRHVCGAHRVGCTPVPRAVVLCDACLAGTARLCHSSMSQSCSYMSDAAVRAQQWPLCRMQSGACNEMTVVDTTLQGCHIVDVELMAAQWASPTAYLKTGDHLHQVWHLHLPAPSPTQQLICAFQSGVGVSGIGIHAAVRQMAQALDEVGITVGSS
jgi:hypothetical protein